MMAQAGASMVLSRLPSLKCGLKRSLATFDRTNTMRAGKVLEAVGPHFIKSTSSKSTAVGHLDWQPGAVRARLQKQLPQRTVVQSVCHACLPKCTIITKTPLVHERGQKSSRPSANLDGPHLPYIRTEVTQQVFDAVP